MHYTLRAISLTKHRIKLFPTLRIACLLLMTALCQAQAQETKGDSAAFILPMQPKECNTNLAENSSLLLPVESPLPVATLHDSLITLDKKLLWSTQRLYLPFALNPTLLYKGDYSTSGAFHPYRTGLVWLAGEQSSLPGIGRINEASVSWVHQSGDRLSLQAALVATQLNMLFFHRHVLELKAEMSYHLSNHLSLHLFGSYDTGNPYNPYGRQWGGSLDWQITDRFGLEGGVRRSYNAVTGRWETLPIVAPYYNFNGKFRLQIDAGPLIQQLIRGAVYGREGRGNPTIAPPKHHIEVR